MWLLTEEDANDTDHATIMGVRPFREYMTLDMALRQRAQMMIASATVLTIRGNNVFRGELRPRLSVTEYPDFWEIQIQRDIPFWTLPPRPAVPDTPVDVLLREWLPPAAPPQPPMRPQAEKRATRQKRRPTRVRRARVRE